MNLNEMFPWPDTRPTLPIYEGPNWLCPATIENLEVVSGPHVTTIVEVGTWLGRSAKWLLEHNPNATIYCVDTWLASFEHYELWIDKGHENKEIGRQAIRELYDQFITNCWDLRSRIVPVRLDSVSAIRLLAHKELKPDFVYLDGGHSFEVISADLREITKAWPTTPVVFDDYNWPGVARALGESGRAFTHNASSAIAR